VTTSRYLLDTHALFFWVTKNNVSQAFLDFFDHENLEGNILVSTICFWELAFLIKKGRIGISNLTKWKNEVIQHTGLKLVDPSVDEMIASTQLPNHHQDPFDRLLIAQAKHHHALLVTKDAHIQRYSIRTFWM